MTPQVLRDWQVGVAGSSLLHGGDGFGQRTSCGRGGGGLAGKSAAPGYDRGQRARQRPGRLYVRSPVTAFASSQPAPATGVGWGPVAAALAGFIILAGVVSTRRRTRR